MTLFMAGLLVTCGFIAGWAVFTIMHDDDWNAGYDVGYEDAYEDWHDRNQR